MLLLAHESLSESFHEVHRPFPGQFLGASASLWQLPRLACLFDWLSILSLLRLSALGNRVLRLQRRLHSPVQIHRPLLGSPSDTNG